MNKTSKEIDIYQIYHINENIECRQTKRNEKFIITLAIRFFIFLCFFPYNIRHPYWRWLLDWCADVIIYTCTKKAYMYILYV